MSALEKSVSPVASLLIRDFVLQLDAAQQATIARWAVKTAMVLDAATTPGTSFYSDDERFALRTLETIPALTTVWLAHHRQAGLTFSIRGNTIRADGKRIHQTGYVTTLAYASLVVQVLTLRPDQETGSSVDGDENMPRPGLFLPIWPANPTVHWPPRLSIPPGHLHRFHPAKPSPEQAAQKRARYESRDDA